MKNQKHFDFEKNLPVKVLLVLSLLFSVFLFEGCEDNPPSDYVPEIYVEAYLLVGEPIAGIKILQTQPTDLPYLEQNAIISDAIVDIKKGNTVYSLSYSDKSGLYYYFTDTNYKVEPNTTYNLSVKLKSGKVITGTTTTPGAINWVVPPKDVMHFPKDTLSMDSPDSLIFNWTRTPNTFYYIIKVHCLDTLNYGIYLTPQTSEKNRRCYNFFLKENDKAYNEIATQNLIADSVTRVVWMAFKWFGKHKVTVYSPDYNFLKWFKNDLYSQTTDPLMNSVTNAIGVFGSASVVSKEFFLVKNQP